MPAQNRLTDDPTTIATDLIGETRPHQARPHVVLKYAQTLDGRIAATGGDARWISCERERAVSHAIRARSDAVLVGVGTVLRDDPQLTVRMVPGASPRRVVLDSALRTPETAHVVDGGADTILLTTGRADRERRARIRATGCDVHEVPAGSHGVQLGAALAVLHEQGVRVLMVEGGARVLTSLLAEGLADRLIVGIAPRVIGAGIEAVGDLDTHRVADGIALRQDTVHQIDGELLVAYDVLP